MRFKRPQVRYADTPQPATPYQSAAQVWDERIGSARVQAKNWRLMAFGCLVLALLMAGGLVWRSAQSIVTPYVVEVDQAGQVRAVGEAATPYRPNDAQIAYHLAHFVALVRSLSIDPIVVRQNWLDAYDYTTDRGAAVLNEYARTHDPFARVGKESVTVQITSVVRASDASFNVRWTEQRFVNGAPSCKPRAPSSGCARTHWASTSTDCRGAENSMPPKEPSHEPVFPFLRFRVVACSLRTIVAGLRHEGHTAAGHLAR
jgi:type IV secretion system protein TrbF